METFRLIGALTVVDRGTDSCRENRTLHRYFHVARESPRSRVSVPDVKYCVINARYNTSFDSLLGRSTRFTGQVERARIESRNLRISWINQRRHMPSRRLSRRHLYGLRDVSESFSFA